MFLLILILNIYFAQWSKVEAKENVSLNMDHKRVPLEVSEANRLCEAFRHQVLKSKVKNPEKSFPGITRNCKAIFGDDFIETNSKGSKLPFKWGKRSDMFKSL